MNPWTIIWPVVNFILFVGLLGYFLRRPARDFWAGRSGRIAVALKQASDRYREAEGKIRDLDKGLAHIEGEIDAMRIKIHEEVAAEKAQMIAQARLEADRIRQEAVAIGRQEVQKAREQLRREMVDLAIGLAQSEIRARLDRSTQGRLLAESAANLTQEFL